MSDTECVFWDWKPASSCRVSCQTYRALWQGRTGLLLGVKRSSLSCGVCLKSGWTSAETLDFEETRLDKVLFFGGKILQTCEALHVPGKGDYSYCSQRFLLWLPGHTAY